MENPFDKLTPDTKYLITNTHINRGLDHSVLTNLYQPIIDEKALALYDLLWSMSLDDHNQLVLHKHYEIQSMLNCKIEDLVDIRKQLEAVKLINTLVSAKKPDVLIYSMNLPLTAEQFLRTDILSIILLGKVGEVTYQQIVDRLVATPPDLGDTTNISASLLDLFNVPQNLIKQIPGFVNDAKQKVVQSTGNIDPTSFEPDSNHFDFRLLLSMLENSYVDENSVKAARDLVLSEHLLYGIDEIQMAKLIQKATNLSTNQLNQSQLKAIIVDNFSQQQVGTVEHQPKPTSSPRRATSGSTDKATDQLIEISKKTAPVVFLQQIKKQKHGIVTSGEQRTLSELVNLRALPNEVINILIYYLLVDENRSTLNKNLMSTIADDWSQHGIFDAEKAINEIKERPIKLKKQAEKRASKYKQRKVNVKETLPDWAKDDQASTSGPKPTTQLTEAQKKQLKEQLDKLKKPGSR
ncbi:replication initiation and membrane attachment protein [Lentilactobacillus sunkii]|jgi:replication initiation and membrane attachment protein|uniref:Replication initiation and membrane attachment protein n=1 Tax=Lentilactobacillus sunkii TaxID=481719 RepID=A0A1E7XCD1_9LACO|nr:DnaD domain protein [Lentilactobacillus sunkii]OFA10691.1 replication initiation and membrane attachment protein [Lentilactobacillus sunkii]